MISLSMPMYVRMSIITSLVGFLFGFDTGSIGPITTMTPFKAVMGNFSDTVHGVVVSSSLITGALSAMVAGILADKYGRIKIIVLGACIDGIGAAIECGSPHIGVFILGRLIKGAGDGLFLSAIYVQVSEISPARRRGTLTSMPQFLIVFGIVSGYFTCYGSSTIGSSSLAWRLPLAIGSFLAFVFSFLVFFVPPSPRWLLAKGEFDRARNVVQRLGFDQAEQDQLLVRQRGDDGLQTDISGTFAQNVAHMFRDFKVAFSPQYRSRTIFGCFLMAMQQFSGIDGVLYYAPILFQDAGLSSTEASFLASGVSAIVIFVVSFPAAIFADKWGRRTSSLTGGSLITVIMFLMGSLYAGKQVHPNSGAARWVVVVCIYLFAVVFSFTWAIVVRAYLVESLPRRTRSSASSLGQSANWIANYIVALVTPMLLSASPYGAYYFFGGMTLISTIAIALFMDETRGASLEAIEQAYAARQVVRDEKKSFRMTSRRVNATNSATEIVLN